MKAVSIFFISLLVAYSSLAQPPAKEEPGKIKGMGKMKGIPEGEVFKLPQGITIEGNIVGYDDAEQGKEQFYDGTGGEWVSVKIKFKNSRSEAVTVALPQGLTIIHGIDSADGAWVNPYQHGILIEQVPLVIPAKNANNNKSSYEAKLLLYCINKGRMGSDSKTTYAFGPVSRSPLMKEFMTLLKGKKLKFTDFSGKEPDEHQYGEEIRELQEIIYHITDGKGLTPADKEYIRKLPNKTT
jgi:hypothetical protein